MQHVYVPQASVASRPTLTRDTRCMCVHVLLSVCLRTLPYTWYSTIHTWYWYTFFYTIRKKASWRKNKKNTHEIMVAPQRQHATGAALATRGVNISIPHHLRLEKYRQPIHSMVRIICAPEKRREESTSATTNYQLHRHHRKKQLRRSLPVRGGAY